MSSSSPVRVAFIGAGDIAQTHAAAVQQAGGKLSGVYDTDAHRAEQLANSYGATVADSVDELLENSRPEVVYILTPPVVHAEQIRIVAGRGLPIMCEKPLTLDLQEARQVIDYAARCNAPLMTGLTHRFHPLAAQARQLLLAGELGKFVASWSHRLVTLKVDAKSWLGSRRLGGGMALQYAMHDLDWQAWLAGKPTQVLAVESSFDALPGVDIEQHLWALLKFRQGGSGSLGVSWAAPHQHVERGVTGSRGNLRIINQRRLVGQNTAGQIWDIHLGDNYDWFDVFVRQSQHVLECVRNGKSFGVTGEDGLQALEISLTVQESALTGKTIDMEIS